MLIFYAPYMYVDGRGIASCFVGGIPLKGVSVYRKPQITQKGSLFSLVNGLSVAMIACSLWNLKTPHARVPGRAAFSTDEWLP